MKDFVTYLYKYLQISMTIYLKLNREIDEISLKAFFHNLYNILQIYMQ